MFNNSLAWGSLTSLPRSRLLPATSTVMPQSPICYASAPLVIQRSPDRNIRPTARSPGASLHPRAPPKPQYAPNSHQPSTTVALHQQPATPSGPDQPPQQSTKLAAQLPPKTGPGRPHLPVVSWSAGPRIRNTKSRTRPLSNNSLSRVARSAKIRPARRAASQESARRVK